MKVAIIGSGISGLVCAHRLHARHSVTLFEAGRTLGGHTRTLRVGHEGRAWDVDTGFIVFNRENYPNFTALLESLDIPSIPAPMTFGVRCDRTGIEWGGASLSGVFAQKRNLLRPAFLRMLADIGRFNARALRDALAGPPDLTVGRYLAQAGYSKLLASHYLVPMAASIWSSPVRAVEDMPLRFLATFFSNHGMLRVRGQPQWRTIPGGARRYVEAITQPLQDRIRLNSPVRSVARGPDGVDVLTDAGAERFDEVIIATHSDQALAMLADPTPQEREVLGAIPYQPNEAVLHWDAGVLPRRRAAWAAWNYHVGTDHDGGRAVTVTYNMSILQSLVTRDPLCVTLNNTHLIDPARVLDRVVFHHPLFTPRALEARARHAEISGRNRTHYCGAYWGNGFHEDGVVSGLRVCAAMGHDAPATPRVPPRVAEVTA